MNNLNTWKKLHYRLPCINAIMLYIHTCMTQEGSPEACWFVEVFWQWKYERSHIKLKCLQVYTNFLGMLPQSTILQHTAIMYWWLQFSSPPSALLSSTQYSPPLHYQYASSHVEYEGPVAVK